MMASTIRRGNLSLIRLKLAARFTRAMFLINSKFLTPTNAYAPRQVQFAAKAQLLSGIELNKATLVPVVRRHRSERKSFLTSLYNTSDNYYCPFGTSLGVFPVWRKFAFKRANL